MIKEKNVKSAEMRRCRAAEVQLPSVYSATWFFDILKQLPRGGAVLAFRVL